MSIDRTTRDILSAAGDAAVTQQGSYRPATQNTPLTTGTYNVTQAAAFIQGEKSGEKSLEEARNTQRKWFGYIFAALAFLSIAGIALFGLVGAATGATSGFMGFIASSAGMIKGIYTTIATALVIGSVTKLWSDNSKVSEEKERINILRQVRQSTSEQLEQSSVAEKKNSKLEMDAVAQNLKYNLSISAVENNAKLLEASDQLQDRYEGIIKSSKAEIKDYIDNSEEHKAFQKAVGKINDTNTVPSVDDKIAMLGTLNMYLKSSSKIKIPIRSDDAYNGTDGITKYESDVNKVFIENMHKIPIAKEIMTDKLIERFKKESVNAINTSQIGGFDRLLGDPDENLTKLNTKDKSVFK